MAHQEEAVAPLNALWEALRHHRTVWLSVMGAAWFWFYAALLLMQVGQAGDARLWIAPALGFVLGALLVRLLSGGKVEIGLVPFGSIGLTWWGVDLFFAGTLESSPRVLADLALLGIASAFYVIPLRGLIALRGAPEQRARVTLARSLLNALFLVAALGTALLLERAGLSAAQVLLVNALMNAAVAVFIYSLVPEFLMRLMVWVLINTLYRIRTEGLEKIPDDGPCVVVANHVSFVDALIIGGTLRRPVRFVMYYKIFRLPVLNFIFRTARTIPIAGAKEDPAMMERAFAQVAEALAAGDVVGVFPEGGITNDGEIARFRPGIERILQKSPVPVVPLALRGLWGSVFSRRDGALKRARIPRRIWSRIDLVAGEPLPAAEATAEALEARVRALRGDRA